MVFTENKNNKNIKNNRSNKNSESSKNNNITDKLDFIEYSASRYGIDFVAYACLLSHFMSSMETFMKHFKANGDKNLSKVGVLPQFFHLLS